jgi:hypothetical protein
MELVSQFAHQDILKLDLNVNDVNLLVLNVQELLIIVLNVLIYIH